MADEALRVFGRIDVLVNNAAVFATLKPQAFGAIPEAEWDRVMAVNVKGIWNCVKAVAPAMKAQGGGRIVNIASAIAPKGSPYLLHYVVSKGAVITMTRALARELGEFGIAVNALDPGLTLSDTVLKNPEITAFPAAPVMQSRAFKREETPADLEGALIFLASSESAFMTGQTVVVDGRSRGKDGAQPTSEANTGRMRSRASRRFASELA
jgi:NAD(P)-dependent dehydrogenase (short-subunit alcohol dehydrogenase family)